MTGGPAPACRVDVAVLGGGTAGSAAAIALAGTGASVAVLDRPPSRGPRVGDVLPPAALPLLEELGVRDDLARGGHLPSHGNRSLWGGPEADTHEFIRDPYGVGWHLDRDRFDAMLARAARARGAAWHRGAWAAAWERLPAGGWRLEVVRTSAAGPSRGELRAGTVVDATGRASPFARSRGAERLDGDRLVGVVGVLAPAAGSGGDRDSLTLVEAVPDGWWYAALLPGGRLSVAFLSDGDVVAGGRLHLAGRWLAGALATRLLGDRLRRHGYRLAQGPRAVVARSSCLAAASGPGWLAAGDAAAAHDPLSAQGMTSALAAGLWTARAVGEGTEAAMRRHSAWVRDWYARYRADLAAYYGQERRWPGSPFWRRRHAWLRGPAGRAAPGTRTARSRAASAPAPSG